MHCKGKNSRARSGTVLIVALVLLAMFAVLAAHFWTGIGVNLGSGASHRSVVEARFLAESGPAIDGDIFSSWSRTNIGCYDDGGETQGATIRPGNIQIVPQSENQLPYGIEKKYTLSIVPSSYAEPEQ